MTGAKHVKLLVLGRDGVVNRYRDDHVKDPAEFEVLPDVPEQIARLNRAGWHVVVATNQSGIGRGLVDMSSLNAVHARMHQTLLKSGGRLAAVFFCPHTPEEACACRKPQPGLLLEVMDRFGATPAQVPVIGDTVRDLEAAVSAGCRPHLLRISRASHLDDAALNALRERWPQLQIHDSLTACVDALLA
ncbi:D-glycero-beta-D-manno-heptose 1,7-bisphosphate 7-phosphatase [Amphibiibacter pelophylacis]|uniref:D-glycero-beta-D-manno-heptose 1,7-bisphosphate 7-phosphatase n=1 Tax=Amphibiibacter pelophylacis TaxID=1799477 RepID=A0ACC6NYC7_9BURK